MCASVCGGVGGGIFTPCVHVTYSDNDPSPLKVYMCVLCFTGLGVAVLPSVFT